MKKEKDKEKKKKRERRPTDAGSLPNATPSEFIPSTEPLVFLNDALGGKWKLRILWALRDGESKRYSLIKAAVTGITDMMLSQSLRELTADGLAARQQFQEIPPRVEYVITPKGAELIPALTMLAQWAVKYSALETEEKHEPISNQNRSGSNK